MREPAYTQPPLGNTYERRDFDLTLRFGSGVIASYAGKDLSVVRNSGGNYTVTLPRSYRARKGFKWGWGKYAAGAVYFPVILTDNSAVTALPVLVIETRTEAGTATDPATGNELDLVLSFSNDISNDASDTAL